MKCNQCKKVIKNASDIKSYPFLWFLHATCLSRWIPWPKYDLLSGKATPPTMITWPCSSLSKSTNLVPSHLYFHPHVDGGLPLHLHCNPLIAWVRSCAAGDALLREGLLCLDTLVPPVLLIRPLIHPTWGLPVFGPQCFTCCRWSLEAREICLRSTHALHFGSRSQDSLAIRTGFSQGQRLMNLVNPSLLWHWCWVASGLRTNRLLYFVFLLRYGFHGNPCLARFTICKFCVRYHFVLYLLALSFGNLNDCLWSEMTINVATTPASPRARFSPPKGHRPSARMLIGHDD